MTAAEGDGTVPDAGAPHFLLVGASGFIGRSILRALLACGYQVECSPRGLRLTDRPALEEWVSRFTGPEVVGTDAYPLGLICAAGERGRPNIGWCEKNPIETVDTNVVGQLNVASVCAAAGNKTGLHCTLIGSGVVHMPGAGDNMQNKAMEIADGAEKDPDAKSVNPYVSLRSELELIVDNYFNKGAAAQCGRSKVLNLRVMYPISADLGAVVLEGGVAEGSPQSELGVRVRKVGEKSARNEKKIGANDAKATQPSAPGQSKMGGAAAAQASPLGADEDGELQMDSTTKRNFALATAAESSEGNNALSSPSLLCKIASFPAVDPVSNSVTCLEALCPLIPLLVEKEVTGNVDFTNPDGSGLSYPRVVDLWKQRFGLAVAQHAVSKANDGANEIVAAERVFANAEAALAKAKAKEAVDKQNAGGLAQLCQSKSDDEGPLARAQTKLDEAKAKLEAAQERGRRPSLASTSVTYNPAIKESKGSRGGLLMDGLRGLVPSENNEDSVLSVDEIVDVYDRVSNFQFEGLRWFSALNGVTAVPTATEFVERVFDDAAPQEILDMRT